LYPHLLLIIYILYICIINEFTRTSACACIYTILVFKFYHSKVQAICYSKASILKVKNRKILSTIPYRLQAAYKTRIIVKLIHSSFRSEMSTRDIENRTIKLWNSYTNYRSRYLYRMNVSLLFMLRMMAFMNISTNTLGSNETKLFCTSTCFRHFFKMYDHA